MADNPTFDTIKPKKHRILRKIPGGILLFLLAVILLVTGVLLGLYSPWLQNALRQRLVDKLNETPGTEVRIGNFHLGFPANLLLEDVLIVNQGDTMIQLGKLDAKVNIKPIIIGKIGLESAILENATYKIGSLDSASCMTLHGGMVKVDKSEVNLSPLAINVTKIQLDDAKVNMYINPADTFPETPATEPMSLNINVDQVKFHNIAYEMQLMPTIYDLKATISDGTIDSIAVDLLAQTVNISSFKGDELNAVYLLPDSAQLASTTVIVKESTQEAKPWTVKLGTIDMTGSKALYTTYGLEPLPGLDFGYIEVNDLNLYVNDFYNQSSTVRLPFEISGVERCGVDLNAKGTLAIDSTGISFEKFDITTAEGTDLLAEGYMGTTTELTDPTTPLRLSVKGNLAVEDVDMMFPLAKAFTKGMRKKSEITADINIKGTSGNLDISKLELNLDRHMKLAASGNIQNVFEPGAIKGDVKFNMAVMDISQWTSALLNGTGIIIPNITLKGNAKFDKDNYIADLTAITGGGKITLDGAFFGKREKYHLDMTTLNFPVSSIMPSLNIGKVTAKVNADGQGFDLYKSSTVANVNIDLAQIEYLKEIYKDIQLKANVGNDNAHIDLNSNNTGLDLHLKADGAIETGKYHWDVSLNTSGLNLEELGFAEEPSVVSADMHLKANISKNMHDIDAVLTLNHVDYNTPVSDLSFDRTKIIFSTTDTITNLSAQNGDLYAFYSSPLPLDSIIGRIDKVTETIDSQIKKRTIDIPELQQAVMPFSLDIEGGNDNALAQLLKENNIRFKNLSVLAGNDTSLYAQAYVYDFKRDAIALDTISFDIRQIEGQLDYTAKINNRPGTFDDFAHIGLDGYFKPGELGVNVRQKNIKNQIGFEIGATLELNKDTTATLHFTPYTPIINYRKWTLNPENFITYDFKHKHLDANLRMRSDVSQIALYTEHANDTIKANHGADEDLILQLFDIQLQDWIALDPFAPPIKGNLSAGVRLNWEDMTLNGKGTVDLSDLMYGKEKVGDFNLDVELFTDKDGYIKTEAELWVNDNKTMVLNGTLNDSISTSPFNLDLTMIHLPLSVANPFLTGTAKLGGSLNGKMDIGGSASAPILDGYLAFENATVDVNMLGATFKMNQDTVPVDSSLVKFSDFKIFGVNENPLSINGEVSLRQLTSPTVDLHLKADNMQIVNTNKARKGADVYGKAFVSLNANAKGNLKFMNVNATVDLMPGTNVSYILAGGTSAIESQAAGSMVKFVNFSDTAAVAAADSLKLEGMILNLNANLNIRTGTIINVDLGTNVQDRVQIQGQGNFNYVSSPVGAGRLTGRYTFSGGFIKYAPPFISNLNFAFTEGSYVSFSGDLMNPQFNIKAVEQMRANVSQAGQNSRLIYFDIILSVTGSLENMNVAFNLETNDDVTVANELASMSPTQRASEAMNLLLYNTYTGGSTKATSNLNGNPLFSFLTNSVNSWLANNVRGVDLSIGVDQYDQTTNGMSSTTTSYSYRVSKTLFNDRIKIIVGGSYSDDPNADGSVAENLINDISVEYFLNNARTMYLRLFRHTGYESILEGEITQTGVGFVYRKRIGNLIDMFVSPQSRYKKKHIKENEEKQGDNDNNPTKDKNLVTEIKDEKTEK